MSRRIIFITAIFILIFALVGCGKTEEAIKVVEDWRDSYPHIISTYEANADMSRTTYGGSEQIDYLVEHPNLKTFYDGYGFSIEYARARGHVYALEDVLSTARPKPGASCFTCKSADFIVKLEKEGIGVNALDFEELGKTEMNTISCYDCHRNEPGVVNITRGHLTKGLEHLDKEHKSGDLACAQCHVEYYIDPDTKAIILPWHNGLGTDGMLEYYDEIGFNDWVHPTTGTELLKAQHPEFETFQGSIHNSLGLTCIDCHMPEVEDGGKEFRSHHWTSPLKNLENASCFACHTSETKDSLIMKVEGVQEKVTNKTNEASDILLELVNELARAAENNTHSEEILNKARDYHRKAQFKWDFVFVENSEGFHNSDQAHKNLDESIKLAKEGLSLLR